MACLLAAAIFLLGGIVLAFDNPSVSVEATDLDGTTGRVGCPYAPWDTGLNDTVNSLGGEHSADFSREVEPRCYDAGKVRFRQATLSGGLGLLLLVVAVVAGVIAVRPDRLPQPGTGTQ
ncbi:hypothetical protein BH11ACT8_BH11ACT8_23270 [soil metagenome]